MMDAATTPQEQAPVAGARRGKKVRAHFISQAPSTLAIGTIIMVIYFVVALTGPFWVPYSYNKTGTGRPLEMPSAAHLLGTDQIGRDVFSRVVLGTRIVLALALSSTLLATTIGGLLGLLSGFLGGWLDEILMRICELLISIPILVFALIVIAAAGSEAAGSPPLMIGVVALVYLPRITRMSRTMAVELGTRDFITAARMRGESSWSIVVRELLPNATGVLLVEFGVRAGWAPLLIGSLGFLGAGARPPIPEWGLMISENRGALNTAPYSVLGPAIALAGLVVGINLFTDGLARMLGRQVRFGR